MVKKDEKHIPNKFLRAAREEKGWSQKQLAAYLGTTHVTVSRWEQGVTWPYPYFRERLCALFGKTLTELGLLAPGPEERGQLDIPVARNPFFVGREELLALLHKRLSNAGARNLPAAQALCGLAGIGKTQAAAEYAFRYGSEYTHVFWVRAASPMTLGADLALLAERLDLPGEQEQDRRIAAFKHWLATHSGWLLILDNADDLVMARRFLPPDYRGHAVYTTRAQATGAIAERLEVEPLSPQEGALLLLRWVKRLERDAPLSQAQALDRALAERIVKEMGGLPMAIVQAAAYIEESGCGLADYAHFYETCRRELLARHSPLLFDYPDTVAASWLLSFRQIEQANAAAAELLRLCAFLAADAIPEELFSKGTAELGAVLAPVAADPFRLNEVLEVLRRYSLIRRQEGKTISVHRLVQVVLREGTSQQEGSCLVERAVRALERAFPEYDEGPVPNAQYYLSHVQECAALVEVYHLAFPEAPQLFLRASQYLSSHGLYVLAEQLLQRALGICDKSLGVGYPDATLVRDTLDRIVKQGKSEAGR